MTNDNSEYKCNRIRKNGSQCSSAAYSCDGIYADGSPLGNAFAGAGMADLCRKNCVSIFAFMAVEGYFHTHNLKKYLLRMLIFAVISEVPFDLMYGGTWFYPVHQNVIWTLMMGLVGIHLMENVRKKKSTFVYILVSTIVVILGGLLGTLSMVDYYGIGVLTVFIFYFFRGRKWWCLLGQMLALYWVNVELLGGLMYPIRLFGMEFELCQQGLALLALLPIWLYRGRQGYHSKPFQYFCYAFYPIHMLVIVLVLNFINR